MQYTYYRRGKCLDCGDIIWTNHPDGQGGVQCKCGKASINHDIEKNISEITDKEFLIPLREEFWWLGGETINPVIYILQG